LSLLSGLWFWNARQTAMALDISRDYTIRILWEWSVYFIEFTLSWLWSWASFRECR